MKKSHPRKRLTLSREIVRAHLATARGGIIQDTDSALCNNTGSWRCPSQGDPACNTNLCATVGCSTGLPCTNSTIGCGG